MSLIEVQEGDLALIFSISNGIFSKYTLRQNLAEVNKLGFENIEFNMKSVEVENDISIYKACKLVDDYGLNCLTLHAATLPVEDAVEVHRAVYYGKISADFAYRLGAPVMVMHSNVSKKLSQDQRDILLVRVFKEIKPYAKNLNLRMALENLSDTSIGFGKDVAELEEIFETIQERSMGLTLDFSHATSTDTTHSLLEKYHERLYNVHMSNREHRPFIKETPFLKEFMAKLLQYRYEGPLTLELNQNCTIEQINKTRTVLENVMKMN